MEVKCAAQKRSVVLLALALLLLVRVGPNGAHADSQQEKSITTQEVLQQFHAKLCAEDEKQLFLANIDWTELPALVENCNIREIAVSAAGDCAMLLSNLSAEMLFIFDSEGQYRTGFSFQANEACSVFFAEQRLHIYFVRSQRLLGMEPCSGTIDVYRCEISATDNLSQLLNGLTMLSTEDSAYRLTRTPDWIPSTTYSALIHVNADGLQTVVYQNALYVVRAGAIALGTVLLFVAVAGTIILNVRKHTGKNATAWELWFHLK